MNVDGLMKRDQQRADAYRLLSACFCLPENRLFADENVYRALRNALGELAPAAATHVAGAQKAAAAEQGEALLVEYARLFVGPQHLAAPPYGSIYLDQGRAVMGESTQRVVARYREEGLAVDDDFHELPDHITVELEFLYFLISRELEAFADGDSTVAVEYLCKQKRFLADHLLGWAPEFCERVQTNAELPHYALLARCLEAFLEDSERPLEVPFAAG